LSNLSVLTSGQALVEVAVVLPLLLVVALGLVQFTLVVHAYNVVTGAAQDGARVAAAVDRTLEDGETHAWRVLQAGLGRSARLSVSGAQRPGSDPEVVEVVAQAELQPVVPLGRGATIPLTARASVTKERFRSER
jgi:Flp pilus assembly protein TadG